MWPPCNVSEVSTQHIPATPLPPRAATQDRPYGPSFLLWPRRKEWGRSWFIHMCSITEAASWNRPSPSSRSQPC